MADGNGELYVGWMERAPTVFARRARQSVVLLFCLAAVVAVVLATRQAPFDPGVFEFGVVRRLDGVVRERPYPTLELERPGTVVGGSARSSYLLVAAGKHGAARMVDGLDGRSVRLSGSLVYRNGMTMIEVVDGSIEPRDERRAPAPPAAEELGEMTLVGEIVDSKCWLGVMKPASLKPHRACATRCISGGIPPLLLVEADDGHSVQFLLVGADGGAVNRDVLHLVAEPLEISGRVTRHGERLVLQADPATYRRFVR